MEEFDSVIKLLNDNSIFGAGVSGISALFYAIWRLLKKDMKKDNLLQAEKNFRDEIRAENKALREEIQTLKKEILVLKSKLLLASTTSH